MDDGDDFLNFFTSKIFLMTRYEYSQNTEHSQKSLHGRTQVSRAAQMNESKTYETETGASRDRSRENRKVVSRP